MHKFTDHILCFMEDLARLGGWDRGGLVAGHAQSGKIANYSGLLYTAADSGYNIIAIVGLKTSSRR